MGKGLLALAVAAVLLASCDRPRQATDTLDRVETLMSQYPDSALTVLGGIDRTTMRRRAEKARYGLLYSQALNKNGVDVRSDSLIRPAVEFYARRGDAEQKALAYFYLGKVYQNCDSVWLAVEYMLKAKDLMGGFDGAAAKGLILSNLGYLYSKQRSFPEAVELYEEAYGYYVECRDLKNLCSMSGSLATLYSWSGDKDKAAAFYGKALEYAKESGDTAKIRMLVSSLVSVEYDMAPDPAAARRKLFDNYALYNGGAVPISDYPLLGVLYFDEGKLDSAEYYMQGALENGSEHFKDRLPALYFVVARLEDKRGKSAAAVRHLYEGIGLMQENLAEVKENLIQDLEQKYNNRQLKQTNYTLRLKSRYQMFLTLAVILASGMAVAFVAVKRRRYAERVEREAAEMNAYVERLSEEHGQLRHSYERLFSDYYRKDKAEERLKKAIEDRLASHKELLRIANQCSGNPKQFHTRISEHLKQEARKDNAFYDIMELVNAKYNGILDYLRRERPALDDDDLCLFGLLCYGLTAAEICMLYNYTNIDTVYNKRSELRRKLGLDGSVRIESYIVSLAERMRAARTPDPSEPDKGAAAESR